MKVFGLLQNCFAVVVESGDPFESKGDLDGVETARVVAKVALRH